MFSCRELVVASALLLATGVQAQPSPYPGIGRAATPREIAAWDIDVRPDFKGLPKGSGSVAKGMEIWEAKCASCHGVFGESNEVSTPIVGGTTRDDIKTGHAERLNDPSFPGRTTMMKLPTVSTLWDYIRRAMPWATPKSLSTDEVYAVTAYILNMAGVVPDTFTMSDQNIADVQKRLPNRNGMTTDHALWPGLAWVKHRPDVMAVACMTGCATEPTLASFLPDFVRSAHGNLADQNRIVGAQHGADTTAAPLPAGENQRPAPAPALIQKYGCVVCHGVDGRVVGPGFGEVSKKYAGRPESVGYLAGKIKAGGSGAWGGTAMPPQSLSDAEAMVIAQWLADGARK